MTPLASFDGGVRLDCQLERPERYRDLLCPRGDGVRIPRGSGLSYVAASFGAGAVSIDHRRFDRILGFDATTGEVEVEAGITLGALFEFLAPRGFYLPVQPGHPAITVGGCVAADAHGKNPLKDGNFRAQVARLKLFHPRHGLLAVSHSADAALFDLTCGGYGLTGSIISATLRPRPLPGGALVVEATPLDGLTDLASRLAQAAEGADLASAWHDLSHSRHFGRGVLVRGSFAAATVPAASGHAAATLSAGRRGCAWPAAINRLTTPWVNAALLRLQQRPRRRRKGLAQAFFPLAGAPSRYFDFYGRAGFHESQLLVPAAAFEQFAHDLEAIVRKHRVAVALASAKMFRGSGRLLRFDGEGVCFAIDVPRSPSAAPFLQRLDALAGACGAVPNLIKDSRLPRAVAQRAYPEIERFRSLLAQCDPQRLMRSELSERLGL